MKRKKRCCFSVDFLSLLNHLSFLWFLLFSYLLDYFWLLVCYSLEEMLLSLEQVTNRR